MEIPLQLLEANIERGTILHSSAFEDIDHGKFFVVMGISNGIVAGFFYINSKINDFIYTKQPLLDLQYLIKKKDYPFLKYDSFINASSLMKIPLSSLSSQLQCGKATYISKMFPQHIEDILEAVRSSKLFTPIEKEQFFY